MKKNEFEFVKLNKTEFITLVEWADKEGWNPGPYDAEVYWNTDPNGYYGYKQNGELIAGGSIVSYNGDFGFMGFFIVKPEYRAKGLGRKLWYQRRDTLLSRLKEGASIGMDGVVDMQPFYKKGGFEIAFRDVRMEGVGKPFQVSNNISQINKIDFPEILEYDKICFGFYRPQFLVNWLQMPENKCFKIITNNILNGFAVLRKANIGFKIGPLFADDVSKAEELFKACSNSIQGEKIYLDIPMINKAAIHLAEKYELNAVFECARMYYGKPPDVPLEKIFGITTFELG